MTFDTDHGVPDEWSFSTTERLHKALNSQSHQNLFRNCQNAIMAIQSLELQYVALFAWILGKIRIDYTSDMSYVRRKYL